MLLLDNEAVSEQDPAGSWLGTWTSLRRGVSWEHAVGWPEASRQAVIAFLWGQPREAVCARLGTIRCIARDF